VTEKSAFWAVCLLSFAWQTVKIPACLPAGKRKPPAGDGLRGEPHVFVSADTRRKSSFGKKARVVNV